MALLALSGDTAEGSASSDILGLAKRGHRRAYVSGDGTGDFKMLMDALDKMSGIVIPRNIPQLKLCFFLAISISVLLEIISCCNLSVGLPSLELPGT